MVVYTVMRKSSPEGSLTALHVEGKVTSGDWEKLREFCLDALRNSDELVLDLEKVSEYDFSLGFFVCLFRKAAQLSGKRLAVRGNRERAGCVYETPLDSETPYCSFTGGSGCALNENLFTRASLGEGRGSQPCPGGRSRGVQALEDTQ